MIHALSSPTAICWAAFADVVEAALPAHAPGHQLALIQVHFSQLANITAAVGQPLAIQAAAEAETRIAAVLRPGDRLLHSGHGDLYALLPGLMGAGHAQLAAQRFLNELERPLLIDGRPINLVSTVGVAMAAGPNDNAVALQRRAGSALQSALKLGRSMVMARDTSSDAMLNELRDALMRNELTMDFQPIVALPERRIAGFEALARWRNGHHGPVPPSTFIPLVEEAGLAAELTRWTLHEALTDFAPLHRRRPDVYCAVNISARAFDDPALVDQVMAALQQHQLPAECLMVEVTETALLNNVHQSAHTLASLAEHGMRIAIDDFGQGYSSLSYLQHLPATVLKIDRSFVASANQPKTKALLEAMTAMAHRLKMRAVAEGVEDEMTLDAVLDAGCNYVQGYLFGRSAPMQQWLAEPAW